MWPVVSPLFRVRENAVRCGAFVGWWAVDLPAPRNPTKAFARTKKGHAIAQKCLVALIAARQNARKCVTSTVVA
jgi:hypothetical protein